MKEPKPEIVIQQDYQGFHNIHLDDETKDRIEKAQSYKNQSTICIIPCFNTLPTKAVESWLGLIPAMNQRFMRIFAKNMEVGTAYSETIDWIVGNPQRKIDPHPELSNWKYILTLEHDNLPPPDGIIKLYEDIGDYDAVGGIYFTKGAGGLPMCYGKPDDYPKSFIPFLPEPDSVTRCNGLGMGFTLFKMDMFKDVRLPRPLFKTVAKYTEGKGVEAYTQDLRFFEDAGKLGYKFACSSRVKVGHYDTVDDFVW